MQLIIDLPPRQEQLELNRTRWAEVVADKTLAQLPYRVETNAFGQITMNPPASGDHSKRQTGIVIELARLPNGQPLAECPISTLDGVKAADVAWYSAERFAQVEGQIAFETAPEICVEVLSPGNTIAEMQTKRRLYFNAGAEEVWECDLEGAMSCYHHESPDEPENNSKRFPSFPSSF